MKRPFLLVISISVISFAAHSQQVLNVATQKEDKRIAFSRGDVLSIKAEKARISIEGWDKDYYDFQIVLKSKHKDEKKAVEELEFLKYSLKKENDTIRFFNFFGASDKFQKVQGILSLDLLVFAPRTSGLVVKNSYGKTKIEGIEGNSSLVGKFVETEINQFQGKLSVSSVFGSVNLTNHSGELFLDLSRTDLVGKNLSGTVIGKTSYGNVKLLSISSEQIEFDSKRTSFELDFASALNTMSFDLSSQFGKIEIGSPVNVVQSGNWSFESSSTATVKVTTTLSPILITGKSFNAQKP